MIIVFTYLIDSAYVCIIMMHRCALLQFDYVGFVCGWYFYRNYLVDKVVHSSFIVT